MRLRASLISKISRWLYPRSVRSLAAHALFLSTDNASNMSGQYSGLQQRLKEFNPLINFVPCASHSLNLVGSCAVINLYDSLANFLTSIRSDVEFSQMEDEAKKLSNCQEYKAAGSRRRKYAKLFDDDPSGNDSIENQSPSEKFKVQTYYAILDILVNELRRRRAAYEDFYQKFEVFSRFDEMSSTDISHCAKRLIDTLIAIQKLILNSLMNWFTLFTSCLHIVVNCLRMLCNCCVPTICRLHIQMWTLH